MYQIKILGKKSWIEVMEESRKVDFIGYTDKFFSNFNNKSCFWTSEERSLKYAWEIQLKNNMNNWGMKTNKNYVIVCKKY